MFKGGKSIVGLDIGAAAVKAVELTRTGRGYEVSGFGEIEVDGHDPAMRIRAISELMQQGGFNSKRIVTSVSGKMVIIRYLSMVRMSDEELRNAILFEAEKYIPFGLDDCVLDCQRLDEAGGPAAQGQSNVLLVAVKRGHLDQHMEIVKGAGLTPEVVDVDAFALGNAWEFVRSASGSDGEDGTIAFVDVGATKTCVNIVQNGTSLFTREIYFGGNDFTSSISQRLGMDETTAESLKRCPGESEADVKDAVFPTIDDLGNELQLSFDYFENQHGRELEKIYLSGGGARFDFFREAFERIFEKPTAVFNPFEGLPISDDIDEGVLVNTGSQFVVAVGLASRIRKG